MPQGSLKKKRKKEYWTVEQEEAVRQYLELEPDDPVADRLFRKKIYPSLRQLVENIAFTYHLTTPDVDVREQVDDCIGHVVYKFRKYDPNKGSKAFSYYGTVAKNYFILNANKSYSKRISSTELDAVEGMETELNLAIDHDVERELDSPEYFIAYLSECFEYALENDLNISTNTWKLGEAVIYILKNYTHISVNTKNTFYHVVREMTGMSTKEITNALKDLKQVYRDTRDEFIETKMTK